MVPKPKQVREGGQVKDYLKEMRDQHNPTAPSQDYNY